MRAGCDARSRGEDALPWVGLEPRQLIDRAGRTHRAELLVARRAEELHDLDEVLLRRVLALEGEVAEQQLR